MQFHIRLKVRDNIVLDQDKQLRQFLGPALGRIAQSDKLQASGIFGGERGGFFVLDFDSLEEMFELFGPEIYANFDLEVQPIMPVQYVGELFGKWAAEGR